MLSTILTVIGFIFVFLLGYGLGMAASQKLIQSYERIVEHNLQILEKIISLASEIGFEDDIINPQNGNKGLS